MNKDQLMEKVKKLLALAGNNPSQEEANSAYAKAQKLIAEYNLNMDEYEDHGPQIVIKPCVHSNNEGYRTMLANILGSNFRCRPIMMGGVVNFIGYEQDVEVCVQVFNHAYKVSHNAGLRREREYRNAGYSTHGVANSYWHGFCAGIKEILDEQCKALMIVVPDAVDKRLKEEAKGTYRGGMRNTGFDYGSYSEGRSDGRAHMRSRELEAH